jgi:hypothetical protein
MNELLKGKNFQLWEYQVSHGSLLIRSPKKSDQVENVDLKFFGVEYISVPRHLKEIFVSDVSNQEIQLLESILGKSITKNKVFVLESSTGRHMIVALTMKIEKNKLEIFESPFKNRN